MNKAPSLALAPACHFEGNVPASAKFPLECAFLLLPYCGLADAIHCDQGLGDVDAAKLLRGDGVALRNPDGCSSRHRARDGSVKFSFTPNRFAEIWTIFPDMRTARFHLCCAICANVPPHIRLS